MRTAIVLFCLPLAFVAVLIASGGRAQEGDRPAPWRPDPLPEIQGMAFVPAGYFEMGSTGEELQRSADVDEFPRRKVWVDDFYIDLHEVTNAQYKVYVDSMRVPAPPKWIDGNYGIGEDGLPVTSVTWEEAAAYARFMGKRLPTEAEWEKAARGADARAFPWGNSFDRGLANNGENLMPIMSFPAGVSPYGLFDMAGNAAEWVDAWYEAYPRGEGDVVPKGLPDRREEFKRDRRVYRGGSWNTFPKYLRCANRESTSPGKRWTYIGFRCAMDPPWAKTSAK
jgi:formylglycine-generating enzyme required for sulfatase activity